MTHFKKLRIAAVSLLSTVAVTLPITASAQFIVYDPTSWATDFAEYAEEATRWAAEIQHYTDQINAYRDQFNQAQDLYDQLNSMKFEDLLSADASGTLARARLQSIYDGTNENFGLGLPDIPSEGMLRYYGNKGFMPTERLYPGDIPDAGLADDEGEAVYAIESVQNTTKLFIDEKDTRMESLTNRYGTATDLKGNMEMNNALLRENADIMLALLALENAKASRDVTDITRERLKKEKLARLFGDFETTAP